MRPESHGGQYEVISNGKLLSDENLDSKPVGREEQASRLRECLAPMLRDQEPINTWLHGPPGTGKTTVAHWVLNEVCHSEPQCVGISVNCWQHRTFYSLLQAIVADLKILGAEAQSTNLKFARIRQALRDRPTAILLDQIDRVMPSEREKMIYGLLSLPRTGLICIGDSIRPLATLDERVRSRLNPALIEFPEYTMSEIAEILADRARHALTPGSWTPDDLRRIASAAEGDARAAIQMLRRAAAAAEEKGGRILDGQLIDSYCRQQRTIQRRSRFEALSEHEKIIWQLAAKRGPLGTTELRRRYSVCCARRRLPPIAKRTFSVYLRQLSSAGLLRISEEKRPMGGRFVQAEHL